MKKRLRQLLEAKQPPSKFGRWLTTPQKPLAWLKPTPLVLGGVLVGLGGLSYLVVAVPQWQTEQLSQEALSKKIQAYQAKPNLDARDVLTIEKGRLDTENAFRTAFIQGLGGTVLLIGLLFTYRNLRVAEDKLVTDRFSKAVEMFSNKDLHTRLGGLYALERIANDSDRDYPQVMEVLCAFVRAESPYPPRLQDATAAGTAAPERAPVTVVAPDPVVATESEASQSAEPPPGSPEWWEQWGQQQQARQALLAALPTLRTDIQAVMTVLGRRKHRYGQGEWETQRLDLRQTDLRKLQAGGVNLTGVDLSGAHLEGAILYGADLKGARLREAHLEDANLTGAHLEGANLYGAHLEGADLYGAHLEGADLYGAHLEGADLLGAHLKDANLPRAHLEDASLPGAHLEGASLYGAHLEGANLTEAHLEDANLTEAHLEGADLSRAHLEGAILYSTDLSKVWGLTQEQLNAVRTSNRTKLPPDLHLPAKHLRTRPPTPQPTTPPLSTAAPEPSLTAPSTSPASSAASTPDPSAEPLTELSPETQTEPKAESEGTSS